MSFFSRKTKIAARDFGVLLAPAFENWASVAINKVAARYRQPTKDELNRFSFYWMLGCAAFIPASIVEEHRMEVLEGFLRCVASVATSAGLAFDHASVAADANARASAYRPPFVDGKSARAAIDECELILRHTFPLEIPRKHFEEIAKCIFIDLTACHRDIIRVLKDVKLDSTSSSVFAS